MYKVSVFNSVVQGGDSVWEGLRVYSGKIFKLDEHLDRSVKEKLLYLLMLTRVCNHYQLAPSSRIP